MSIRLYSAFLPRLSAANALCIIERVTQTLACSQPPKWFLHPPLTHETSVDQQRDNVFGN